MFQDFSTRSLSDDDETNGPLLELKTKWESRLVLNINDWLNYFFRHHGMEFGHEHENGGVFYFKKPSTKRFIRFT